MARKNFKDLRAGLVERIGEDAVVAAEEAERERYELEQLALGDVRRARAMTQTQLAKALGVSQAQVSRIESQTDLFLSTLASYVEAMGGELELVATFPDRRVALSVGDLAESSASPAVGEVGGGVFAEIVAEELGVPSAGAVFDTQEAARAAAAGWEVAKLSGSVHTKSSSSGSVHKKASSGSIRSKRTKS